MNDEEQGFTCQTNTQFVELNYIPISPTPYTQRNPLPNNIKVTHNPLVCSLINQDLITSMAQKFMEEHSGSIIFNNFSRRQVKYQNQIVFESNFQCGNLQYVTEIRPKEYELYMRADTNTRTHHQWFYFKVKNKKLTKITMVIRNFMKSSLLYRRGLKPYARSMKQRSSTFEQIISSVGFEEHLDEYQNTSYSLKFDYVFEHRYDQVQFCTEPPYTFTRLTNILKETQFRTIQMGKTVMGRKIQALMVNECKTSKAVVVVIARQHPGESVGSWLMEGFLERLKVKENDSISWLVVPMINIDGVLLGNNRTGLLGYDFNRHWNADQDNVREHIFPEIMGILNYFKRCRRQKYKRIKIFLDLHGHSSEANVFSYGPPHPKQSQHYENSRLFPFLMSKRNENFKLNQCSYEIEAGKKNCARSVFHNRLGFPYSYTIESSFGLYSGRNVNQTDMLKVGIDLCETVLEFVNLVGKEKEEGFEKILSEMKVQSEKYNTCQHIDSDSDDQKEETNPAEYKNKMSAFFSPKKSSVCRSKLYKEKYKSTWENTQPKQTIPNSSSQAQILQPKKSRSYLKTQPFHPRADRLLSRREVRLPNIGKQQFVHGNIFARRSVLTRNNRKANIRTTQPCASSIDQCTIGKGVVILNGYKRY